MKFKILFFGLMIVFLSIGNFAIASENDSDESKIDTTEQSISENPSRFGADETRHGFKRRFLAHGSRRTDNPFRAQVTFSSGGMNTLGYSLGGGVHLGFQISKSIAVGLTSQAFYNDYAYWTDRTSYGYDVDNVYLGQEGAKKAITEIEPRHLLEMQFFPWDFGLFFSAGVLHFGKQRSYVEFKKRDREIGENEYNTGLTADLEYAAWTGPALGVGYNYIFSNGFSLGVGFSSGFTVLEPEVTVTSTSVVAVDDMEDWQSQIERNERTVPHMFYFGVGYAF